ncbi:hypothetical protein ACFE04_028068 [Oxalis oulophora]
MAANAMAYPERFYAAASYAGVSSSSSPPSNNNNSTTTTTTTTTTRSSSTNIISNFSTESALLLYALYQQATVGPCNTPKPSAWSPVELSKWKSWQGLGTMASTEAMRLFVKILEEEDPGWYYRASNFVTDSVVDVQMNGTDNAQVEPVTQNGNSLSETKNASHENGGLVEIQDKDVVSESIDSTFVYDQWIAAPISGPRPKPRYEHGAAVIQDKMYVFGGNHNGRYLSDLHVLNFRSWTWSKVEAKSGAESAESQNPQKISPCAGHSLISWDNKLLSVAGHTKDPSEGLQVNVFDPPTHTWSPLKTYGKPPISRGSQSVTLVGTSLVIFGGQDSKRSLLNDLHILDLETMTWDEIDAVGVPPSPRSDHAAAVHDDRYLLIFGGGSHATCFNDLHVLDIQAMEWSRPTQQGEIPSPRAGHAGATIGENWFIVGGGDNKSGVSETLVLNMSTLTWSVVTGVEGRVPIASEGSSLVVGFFSGQDMLVSFGGYNGRYNNEVHVLKPSHESTLQSKMTEAPNPDNVSAVHNATNPREINMDNADREQTKSKSLGTSDNLENLKTEKEELESSLGKEKLQSLELKQELSEAENQNAGLYKELQSVRGQLAAEQSRCFKLEVDVAELRQKLQTMETLQKELELLQRQKAASEQAALNAKQKQGSGVWGWLAGNSGPDSDDES